MAEQRFEVQYTYYQYNSGAADNGTYTRTRECKTAEEAAALAFRIEADAKAQKEGRAAGVDHASATI